MRVGEKWSLKEQSSKFRSDAVFADVIKITRLYRDDEEKQDYVDYTIVEDRDLPFEDGWVGGGMKRETFLDNYRKLDGNL